MFKIIILVLVIATGQLGNLTYFETYESAGVCEADKPRVEELLYKFLDQEYDLQKAAVRVELTCEKVGEVPPEPAATVYTHDVLEARNAYRISYDGGGFIREYIKWFNALRDSRGFVIVDGMCISACTLMIPLLDREQVCVTPNARFAFHSATDQYDRYHPASTRMLWNWYPQWLRALLRDKGWDADDPAKAEHPDLIYLEGDELAKIYESCTPAQMARL